MDNAQLLALKSEVLDDPLGKGYSALLPDSPGHVVNLLDAKTEIKIKSRMVTARAILSDCGTLGSSILDKLEAAAASNSAVKWAVKFLGQAEGVDVGNPATQAMINQLEAATVLSVAEAEALRNLALQPASRAEVLGLTEFVTEATLQKALES